MGSVINTLGTSTLQKFNNFFQGSNFIADIYNSCC